MSSATRWEIDQADWDLVKTAVKRHMVASARARTTLSYTEPVNALGHFSGPDSHALAVMLGEISSEEDVYKVSPCCPPLW